MVRQPAAAPVAPRGRATHSAPRDAIRAPSRASPRVHAHASLPRDDPSPAAHASSLGRSMFVERKSLAKKLSLRHATRLLALSLAMSLPTPASHASLRTLAPATLRTSPIPLAFTTPSPRLQGVEGQQTLKKRSMRQSTRLLALSLAMSLPTPASRAFPRTLAPATLRTNPIPHALHPSTPSTPPLPPPPHCTPLSPHPQWEDLVS